MEKLIVSNGQPMKMKLQFFATNQDQPVRRYEKQFAELLPTVFEARSYFGDFFAGDMQALDGVQENATAFSVKTSDLEVVIGEYDKDANTAFGTGTGNSTRFGERQEMIYTNTDVPYTFEWAWHVGIDRHTVNNDFDAAIADVGARRAEAVVNKFNNEASAFIAESAGETRELADVFGDAVDKKQRDDAILKYFNDLATYYTNLEAVGTLHAKVKSELYNAIVDHPLVTTGKNSNVNIDSNNIVEFKGFQIQKLADKAFQEGSVGYAYVGQIGKAFTGINTARTMESEDFDGVAFQGAGKGGHYVLEDNKKAIVNLTLGDAPAPAAD